MTESHWLLIGIAIGTLSTIVCILIGGWLAVQFQRRRDGEQSAFDPAPAEVSDTAGETEDDEDE